MHHSVRRHGNQSQQEAIPRRISSLCRSQNTLVPKIGWPRTFEDSVLLPDGRELITLKSPADYIMTRPKAEQKHEKWQTAIEVLIMAAEGRGPLMRARIGVLHALNRNVERVFTDRKRTAL